MGGWGHPSVMTVTGKYLLPFLVPLHPIIGLLEALEHWQPIKILRGRRKSHWFDWLVDGKDRRKIK